MSDELSCGGVLTKVELLGHWPPPTIRGERARCESLMAELIHSLNQVSDIQIAVKQIGEGLITLAIRRYRVPDGQTVLQIGAALCGPGERFDSLLGLSIALGRLRKHPITIPHAECLTLDEHIRAVRRLMFATWKRRWPSWAHVEPPPVHVAPHTTHEITVTEADVARVTKAEEKEIAEGQDAYARALRNGMPPSGRFA